MPKKAGDLQFDIDLNTDEWEDLGGQGTTLAMAMAGLMQDVVDTGDQELLEVFVRDLAALAGDLLNWPDLPLEARPLRSSAIARFWS